jgi:hypothetical protein
MQTRSRATPILGWQLPSRQSRYSHKGEIVFSQKYLDWRVNCPPPANPGTRTTEKVFSPSSTWIGGRAVDRDSLGVRLGFPEGSAVLVRDSTPRPARGVTRLLEPGDGVRFTAPCATLLSSWQLPSFSSESR